MDQSDWLRYFWNVHSYNVLVRAYKNYASLNFAIFQSMYSTRVFCFLSRLVYWLDLSISTEFYSVLNLRNWICNACRRYVWNSPASRYIRNFVNNDTITVIARRKATIVMIWKSLSTLLRHVYAVFVPLMNLFVILRAFVSTMSEISLVLSRRRR